MRILVVVGAMLGGLAFWRRKSLRSDTERSADAIKTAGASASQKLGRGGPTADADEEPSDDGAMDNSSAPLDDTNPATA